MSGAGNTAAQRGSPFNRTAVLGMVVIGFIAFIAMLYFLSVGDTGDESNNGGGHAAANGLNGYSALARLVEAEGYDVVRSREESGLDTPGLLVVTPPAFFEADALDELLRRRAYTGPTMVIVPKWFATNFPPSTPPEIAAEIKDGWVRLGGASTPDWLEELGEPYTIDAETLPESDSPFDPLEIQIDDAEGGSFEVPPIETVGPEPLEPGTWAGFQSTGSLPTGRVTGANAENWQRVLVVDGDTRALALQMQLDEEYDPEPVTFVIEPDLMNNYGLSDGGRAALALKLIEDAGYGPEDTVTFDLTLNGLGGTVNLLTLAFRPPFLAATLCLILALLIVGWRAFKRFGPPVASGPAIAFGKSRLVTNGAALILRARRLGLLAEPYADLSARRLADALGLAKPDPEAIDAALRVRLPQEEPYTLRAQRLRAANAPSDILRAAQALKELEGKLSK